MLHSHPVTGRSTRRLRALVFVLGVVAVLVAVVLVPIRFAVANSSSAAPSPEVVAERSSSWSPGIGDGYIADGESISLWSDVPAITRLDPALLSAARKAASDAARDGVDIRVTNGWRSAAYQQRLLDDAVLQYGSLQQALRWVSTPQASHHVTGHAIDIGPTDADDWLHRHGADYGLCQTYSNEIWHFELRETHDGECPPMLSDAAS